MKPGLKPKPLERDIQRNVVALYRLYGCATYSTSQMRPSKVALGLPDLYVIPPAPIYRDGRCAYDYGRPWWNEIKRPGAKPRPEQADFKARCEAAGTTVVVGGLDEALAHLKATGFKVLR